MPASAFLPPPRSSDRCGGKNRPDACRGHRRRLQHRPPARGRAGPPRHGADRGGEGYLGLGAEIIRRGHIGAEKLAETAEETRRFAAIARELDAEEIDVFVTAPARQAVNADQLVATIARATGHFVRVLSAREEGELAYEGAIATTAVGRGPVAVCDVGGGSTEITVGDRKRGSFWSGSVDLGSLRLTATALHDDPPTAAQLAEAEALVAGLLLPVRAAADRDGARGRRQRPRARQARRPAARRGDPRRRAARRSSRSRRRSSPARSRSTSRAPRRSRAARSSSAS